MNDLLALCRVLLLAVFGLTLASLLVLGDPGEALLAEHVVADDLGRLRDQTHA